MPSNDHSIASMPVAAIAVGSLRRRCDPSTLNFQTTDDLPPVDNLIGQERALDAIRFGSSIERSGYNVFALGPQGTGRHAAVLSYLGQRAAAQAAPDDWVYVHNFASMHKPQAMRLPPGTAVRFRDAMDELVTDLRNAIPAQFQSDEYRQRRRAIAEQFQEARDATFEELRNKAEEQDVAVMQTPVGFALAPTHDGQVVKSEVFNMLPKEQRHEIELKIEGLQKEMTAALEQLPQLEKQQREQIQDLNSELTAAIVDSLVKALSTKFAGTEAIEKRLQEVRDDIVKHAEIFVEGDETESAGPFPKYVPDAAKDTRFHRYMVNVIISNNGDGDKLGAPLVSEDHPTLANMVGRVEHISQFGALTTDFTMIRPGALHRANGGYLVLDARRVLSEPFAWEALKRALRSETVTIVSAAEQLSLVSTISLEPEPIPLKVKVVLIGERMLYYLLSSLDPEFSELFNVEADFDEQLPTSQDNIELYARLIAAVAKRENLCPLDRHGVACVIEEIGRFAADAERLSLNVGRLTNLLGEAEFWAKDAGRSVIGAGEVDRAVSEQVRRADRIRQRSQEAIERGTILIDTDGRAVGQVNGLSILSIGKTSFGQPTRITARARMGSGKVVDIEREVKLGGPLHTKGVLILSGYLAATFALDVPMSLWASIVFEQTYGGVDGDSASSAELYALLSALAEVPINQSFAVTGSVNQNGGVQAIGGVNEKIEGFFDVCQSGGLTGCQGVLIPASNQKHLMLRSDVVRAAEQGLFHIYPIETISQGIQLLTGNPAGVRGPDGNYPKGTINGLVEATLRDFAEARRSFAADSIAGEHSSGDEK
jgi:lon-related putative ATP-dependent protease